MKIRILTDTSCGIAKEEAESLGYEVITLPFLFDDKEYVEGSLSNDEFYEKLKSCSEVHTSQASLEVVANKFDEMLKTCDHIIYLPISSGLSGSYQSTNVLVTDDKYKDKVTVIDHKTISVLQRALLLEVKNLIDKGVEPKKIKELVEANAKNNRIYIAVDTLEYLKKGGRVSPLVAAVGNLLNIKPILFSDGGKFDVVKKVRSMKLAGETIKELIKNDLNELFNGESIDRFSIGVSFTKNVDEASKYKDSVEEEFGVKAVFDELPQVVGCHIGEGAIAMAIYKYVDEH